MGNGFLVELYSTPNTSFLFEFFASPSPDPSGYGKGQQYQGNFTWGTDSTGYAAFLANSLSFGQWLTVTATDPFGSTSEFSLAVQVPPLGGGGMLMALGAESGNDDENGAEDFSPTDSGSSSARGAGTGSIIVDPWEMYRWVLLPAPSQATGFGPDRNSTSPASLLAEFLAEDDIRKWSLRDLLFA